MNGFIRLTLYFVFFLLCQTGHAGKSFSYDTEIKKLLPTVHEDLNIGVVIANPQTGKILYQKNADRNFLPASTLKLLTAYSALKLLSPQYKFQTSVLTDLNQLRDGVLQSDVVIKFDGDPTLTIDDLDNLIRELKAKGVNKINGKIMLLNNHNNDPWAQGMAYDDLKFCYAAPIGSIIVDENCFVVDLYPQQHTIQFVYPKPFFSDFDKVAIKIGNKENVELVAHENNNYELFGEINSPLHLNIAVQNQYLYAKKIIQFLLHKNNIENASPIRPTMHARTYNTVITHRSEDLAKIIFQMLKDSNNCMANAVFKKLSSINNDVEDSWTQSAEQVKTLLGAIAPVRNLKIYDGSGVSRYDLITPTVLIKLLNASYKDEMLRNNLLPALPISGTDGTLLPRMQNIKGRVMAKTGTQTGISSLAGFIKTKRNHLLSFVLMINNGISEHKTYRDLEDKICLMIYEKG